MITKIQKSGFSNNYKDNIIFFSAILMPFALNISILVSEILLFLISITFMTILFKGKKNNDNFKRC